MHNRYFHTFSIISTLAAVVALFISIRSCQVSSEAYRLASAEYVQERTLLLAAEFSKKNDIVKLKPTNNEITFLKGIVTFPSEIYDEPVPVGSNGELWRMSALVSSLENYALKKAPRENGLTKVQSLHIPVIVESYYAAKGDTYTDKSLYFLGYDAFVYEDSYKEPSLHFRELLFALKESHLQSLDADILKKIINKELRVRMPYGSPSPLPKK